MNKAERRFIDFYNQVNEDQRHEMACENEDMTGSRLRKGRACRTQGASQISEAAAREYMRGLDMSAAIDTETVSGQQQRAVERDFGGPLSQQVGASPPAGADEAGGAYVDAGAKLEAERQAFDAHLDEMLEKHPELRQRLEEFLAARARYEASRRK